MQADVQAPFPLLACPDDILEKIYKKVGPGDPERLRVTCKRLNIIYEKVEGTIPLKQINAVMTIFEPFPDDQGMNVKFEDRSNPPRFCFHYRKPTFQRFIKCLQLASELRFGLFGNFQKYLDKPKQMQIVLDIYAKQSYQHVVVQTIGTVPITTMLNYLKKEDYLTLRGNQLDLETIDTENLQKLSYVYVAHYIRKEVLQHTLDRRTDLRWFSIMVKEEMDLEKYYEEYIEGNREIFCWTLFFPMRENFVPTTRKINERSHPRLTITTSVNVQNDHVPNIKLDVLSW